jgi:hypothetical protein
VVFSGSGAPEREGRFPPLPPRKTKVSHHTWLGCCGAAMASCLAQRLPPRKFVGDQGVIRPGIQPCVASPFTLRRQTLRVCRCPFLASHTRNAAANNARVRVIGSTWGAEEIPAVAAIPLSRRRIRRLASFFSFRAIFPSSLFAASTATRLIGLNGEIPRTLHYFLRGLAHLGSRFGLNIQVPEKLP